MEESLRGERRGSKFFTLAPVIMAGDIGSPTTTASPPLSPSASMSPLVRPPTHGGGPLSSHPTTPIDMPGAWVSTSDLPSQAASHAYIDTPPSSASPSLAGGVEPSRFDSFRTPLEPASASTQRRGTKSVRKLLSLSSLRNSFLGGGSRKSSASSLNSATPGSPLSASDDRGRGAYQRAASASYPQGIKRSASPLVPSIYQDDSHEQSGPPLRKKKSAGWFRRKSQIFLFGQDGSLVDSEAEEKATPNATHDEEMGGMDEERAEDEVQGRSQAQHKDEFRHPDQSYEPPQRYQYYDRPQAHQGGSRPQSYHSQTRPQSFTPQARPQSVLLPELDELGGGGFNGGSLGGDNLFANIGR